MEKQAVIWLDGKTVPWSEANVHVTSYGLLLGIGFFEAFRCFDTIDGPALFRVDDHLKRLRETAHTYLRPLYYSSETIKSACKQVLRENDLTAAYLRVVVFVGEGENPAAAPFHTAVIATETGPYVSASDESGIHAMISSVQRPDPNVIPPAAKATGQYLNATLAQLEAMTSGYDSALLLNHAGFVVDGYIHNIFAVRDGALSTPPVSAGALAGITRASVMTLAAEQKLSVWEQNMVRTDLYNADEVFVTGTQSGIIPVISVDRRQIGEGKPGDYTRSLMTALDDIAHARTDTHREWLEAARAEGI